MTPERWQQVKGVLQQALELAPDDRSSFLDRVCSTDPSLRQEVESLLSSSDEVRSSFLELPAIEHLTLSKGTKLGDYEVVTLLASGGMGEVYRAHDPRLGRDVAIKVLPYIFPTGADRLRSATASGLLPEEVSRDQKAIERFQREARAASALNHPHICTIYDVGEHEGRQFIVMEFLEGETLEHHIAAKPLDEQQIAKLGTQIADALNAAHAKGIIHRDVKPTNIFVTLRGEAKLLDFGLSKLTRPLDEAALAESASETQHPMGTLPYMAPEQLRGEKTDARTDIWGAGAVLYEMATGQRPFPENQGPLLVESILHETSRPPSALNPKISSGLESVISKAMEKNPRRRYQSAGELRADLQRLSAGAPPLAAPRSPRWLAAAVVVVLLLALAASWHLVTRPGKRVEPARPIEVRRSVAVLGFKNLVVRPEINWLSTALAEMLTTEIAAGEKLRTVPADEVTRTNRDLGISEPDALPKDTLKRVGQNLGADFVVSGSYSALGKRAGGQVRLDIRVQDTAAGETLASLAEVGTEDMLFDLVSRTGADLRQKLGLGAISAIDTAAMQASRPSNPRAERFYGEGLAKLRLSEFIAARNLLQKAVAADPKYPLAHAALASALSVLGYDAKATEESKLAFQLSGNLSREDRLQVEGRYREMAQEWDVAIELYRTLMNFFPDNLDYGLGLANAQASAGKAQDALGTLAALRRLPSPAHDDPRIDLAEANADEALSDFKRVLPAVSAAVAKATAQGARLLLARGRLLESEALFELGEFQKAMEAGEQAERIYRVAGDPIGIAHALNSMAFRQMQQHNPVGANRMLEQSLAIKREIGDKRGEAATLSNIAIVHEAQGDLSGAIALKDQSLALYREVDDKRAVSELLNNSAISRDLRGDLLEAQKRFEQSIEIARAVGNKRTMFIAADNRANVLTELGELAEAKKAHEESLTFFEDGHVQSKHFASGALDGLGEILEVGGDLVGARRRYDDALAMRKELGVKGNVEVIALAELSIAEGRPAEAEAPARRVAEESRTAGDVEDEAPAYVVLARAFLAQGKTSPAQEALATATPLVEKSANRNLQLKFAIVAAQVRAASGRASDIAQAIKSLRATLTEATRYRYLGYQFEARLALGEIEMKSGRIASGRARLAALQKDATAKGFLLISRKAAAGIRGH